MIPLRDNIPSRTTPFINYLVIACCSVVFFLQLAERPGEPSLVEHYGMIPARVMNPEKPIYLPQLVRDSSANQIQIETRLAADSPIPPWMTLLTCIFLHGGWLHFVGNMWFLYIFGDNVEDRFGHVGFLLFYLGCGIAASFAHLVAGLDSTIPTIGASGAIAGVMGAYLLLYPKAKVQCLIPLGFIIQIMVLPAFVFLGFWFFIQFFQAAFAIGSTQAAGVAWWAHIGGFVVGLVVVWLLERFGKLRPKVETIRPNTDHITHYRFRPRRRW